MAEEKPAIGETRWSKPQTNADCEGVQPDNVDDLVSSFLTELAGLSSEIGQIRRSEIAEATPARDIVASGSRQTGPAAIERDEEAGITEPDFAMEDIDKQINEALTELERLISNAAAIAAREGSGVAPPPPPLESEGPLRIEESDNLPHTHAETFQDIDESSGNVAGEDSPKASLQSVRSPLFSHSLGPRQRRTSILLFVAVVVGVFGMSVIYLFRYKPTPTNVEPVHTPSTFMRSDPGDNLATPKSPIAPVRTLATAEVLERVLPTYPASARRLKLGGRVQLEIDIDGKGNVVNATAGSGPALLRGAAEEAVKKWKFKPATVDGVNVASKATVAVTFNSQ